MIKKKLSILLLQLLVVLFIGFYSTSYAYNYSITDADIDTIFTAHNMGSTWNNLKTYCKNYKNTIYQTYDTCVIALNYYSSQYYIYIYGFDASDVTNVLNPSNVNYMGVTLSANGAFYQLTPNQQNFSQISVTANTSWLGSANFGTGSQKRTKYLVVPNDLGNNLFSGPWQSSQVLTFTPPAPQRYFYIEQYDNNLTTKQVEDYATEVYYASKNYLNSGVLNYFTPFRMQDFSELNYISKKYYAYDYYNKYWYWYKTQNYYNFEYSGDFYIDEEYNILYIREEKNQKGDIIEKIEIVPKDDEFIAQYVCLYYGSPYTYVSGDYISMHNTFTGSTPGSSNSYYDNYHNNVANTEQENVQQEQQEDMKSFLEETYNKWFVVSRRSSTRGNKLNIK